MSEPIAVLISDIHYSLNTLELADKATRMAIEKANELQVPLIIPGDLHDTKANLRGECIKAMINTLKGCRIAPIVIVGNHCKINEKSEEHSLEFLRPYATIIDKPMRNLFPHWTLIPYYHDTEKLKAYLQTLPKQSNIIMHQGILGSNMGDYIQDKSALSPNDLAGHRVVSGHYHNRQTIRLPNGGIFDYVGNPYTLTYGEANDETKGFQILKEDGSLEFVPTNLRKHVIWEELVGVTSDQPSVSSGDIWWIKIRGTREQLQGITKSSVPTNMPFKLDLIPTDTKSSPNNNKLSKQALLDNLIDSLTNTTDDRKNRLKTMWKDLCS